MIVVADTIRDNAQSVVAELKRTGNDIILMTGDNPRTANAIGNRLGISNVLAEVSPQTKAQEIMKLQDQGKKVAIVGDGINDAPALTQADIGIAMGSGTDVAQASGHVILLKSDRSIVLIVLPWLSGSGTIISILNNLVVDGLVIVLSIPPGKIKNTYGSWDRLIM